APIRPRCRTRSHYDAGRPPPFPHPRQSCPHEEPMFYEPRKRNHGLPHDPFKAIVAPRPIGWITSMSAAGEINLAPYSYFNAVSSDPPMLMFASEGPKDSVAFIEWTKVFVGNLATFEVREQISAPDTPTA